MNEQRSSRTLIAAGLLSSLLLGVLISAWLLRDATATQTAWREERIAVIALNSLIDLVERSGDNQEVVSSVVERWRQISPSIVAVRVTDLDNRSITATTHKDDLDRGAVPRRLVREEKAIFDRGQRIVTNVEENRAGGTRRAEIEMERTPDGGFALAGPVERDGEIVGIVEMTRKSEASPSGMPGLPMGLAILVPVIVFALIAAFVGEKRVVLFVVALALLTVALFAYGRYSVRVIGGTEGSVEAQLAQRVTLQTERSKAVISELKLSAEPELTPAKWDTDLFRRPRAKSGAADAVPGVARAMAGIWVISALVLAFLGLGWAARLGRGMRKHRQAIFYTAPAMIGMLLLVFFPFFYGIILSFTDQTIYTTNKPLSEIFVGLRNYVDIVGHFDVVKRAASGLIWNYDNFYWTLLFTVAWTIVNVTIGVSVGLLLALILNTKGLALKPVYRVLLILPWAVPNYITALIWRGMFHQQFGVVNQLIQMFGGTPVAWFDHTATSFFALVATNGWLSFPFMMVISLGALQSISADLYEAARVDGASRWQQFRSITLPSLKPALIPAIILSVVWTFNMFNIIYLVSAGNPAGSTEILITKAYKLAFEQYRYGYAAAYSTVIFIILMVYGTWQNRVTRATEAIG